MADDTLNNLLKTHPTPPKEVTNSVAREPRIDEDEGEDEDEDDGDIDIDDGNGEVPSVPRSLLMFNASARFRYPSSPSVADVRRVLRSVKSGAQGVRLYTA
ncbi:hypothetical protein AAP_06169 [Ascosphaera apis ARSEF 7405]|uniref:Uncharacterized protein n=1 Tax=Ascosphaera apis ARSEF 7405 TaxID=392613 RepID=A0A166MZ81_9EURO|nr:hypothetical protein AAP_06169 [Ascosphaera apis ARSEF 7405]